MFKPHTDQYIKNSQLIDNHVAQEPKDTSIDPQKDQLIDEISDIMDQIITDKVQVFEEELDKKKFEAVHMLEQMTVDEIVEFKNKGVSI